MGFDVTYHPITEAALHEWYLDFLVGSASVADRCAFWAIPELFRDKLVEWVEADQALEPGTTFDHTIGFHAAAAAGIFSRYHYVRDGRLSQIPSIDHYTKSWREIVPQLTDRFPARGSVTQNFSSGVFIPPDRLVALRRDLDTDPRLRAELAKEFSGGYLDVLLAAIDEAIATGRGLLEATDVIVPNPLDLNATRGESNRLNCDLAGPLLYRDQVMAQVEADPELREAYADGQLGMVTHLLTPDGVSRIYSTVPEGEEASNQPRAPEERERWGPLVFIAIAVVVMGWVALSSFSGRSETSATDAGFVHPYDWIDDLEPGEPWPRWHESLLRSDCYDGGDGNEQFLMCTGPDGTPEWTRDDLGENCRMYPVPPAQAVAVCRRPPPAG